MEQMELQVQRVQQELVQQGQLDLLVEQEALGALGELAAPQG